MHRYDVVVIGLNAVTAYVLAQIQHYVDSVLVVTSLPEELVLPYGVCLLDYLYATKLLDLPLDNITVIRPAILKVSPKLELTHRDIRECIVKSERDCISVRIGAETCTSRFVVVSHEVDPSRIRGTLADLELLEKIRDGCSVSLRGSRLLKLAELGLTLQERGVKFRIQTDTPGLEQILQELSLKLSQMSTSQTDVELSVDVPVVEPTHVEISERVLDLRLSSRKLPEVFLMGYALARLLDLDFPEVRLDLILTQNLTCYVVGLLKYEVQPRVRECSTTRTTVHLPSGVLSYRLVFRGTTLFGVSVVAEGDITTRLLADVLLPEAVRLLTGRAVVLPFCPSSLFTEPRLSPVTQCLINMLRDLKLEKLFKPRIKQSH